MQEGLCLLPSNLQITLYFFESYGLSLTNAAVVGSTFGLMNLFARGFGAWLSDWTYKLWGMLGRKICLVIMICLEGMLLVIFSQQKDLSLAYEAIMKA